MPVLEMEEPASHPQHRARAAFFTTNDRRLGPVELPRLPLESPPRPGGAPGHGQHTEELLAEEGLTAEEIAALRHGGVIK